jgi:glycosyltransferase involved in cell wall biosynthesis
VLVVGSASIHTARFAHGLCDAGQPVVLVTHDAMTIEPHAALLDVVSLDLSVRRLGAPRQLRRLMQRWSPRIVHAHQANSVGWHAGRAAHGSGVPLVLTLWGSDVLATPSISPLHRWMARRALAAATAWTADAHAVLEAAAALHGSANRSPQALWIPLGIDDPPVRPLQGPGAQQERRILSCRLHKPLYRVDVIVAAFAALARDHPAWTLEVAAGGPGTADLVRLAAGRGVAGRVEFTGMLDPAALARSYQRAALFASVPVSDGTSVSLLESMAAGCLPVLSDLPANREWVADGRNGVLVADIGDLEQGLRRAIGWWESGRWASEGIAPNLQTIREKALFTGNIRQFLALYAQLAGD